VNSEIMNAADELRQLIAKADALASVTEEQFGRVIYVPAGADRRGFERVAQLVGLTATAASVALEASNRLVDAVENALRRAGV
jgi:malic enzyme